MYHNASSLRMKLINWSQLKRVMKKHNIDIPDDVIDATIHCKDGAAFILLQLLFERLTNRQLDVVPPEPPIDFTDHGYQSKIPIHARSTAIQAIRNNIKFTELMTTPNFIINRQKAQAVIARHTQDRERQRIENADRFDRRPTLGELARRHPPPLRHVGGSMENVGSASPGSHVGFDEESVKHGLQSGSSGKKSSNQNNRSSGIRRTPSAVEIIVTQSTHPQNSLFQDISMAPAATSPPPPAAAEALSLTTPTKERCPGGMIICECCN